MKKIRKWQSLFTTQLIKTLTLEFNVIEKKCKTHTIGGHRL